MALPAGFTQMLETVNKSGIMNENSAQIRSRLDSEIGLVAGAAGPAAGLGGVDWAVRLYREFEAAIHEEICDPQKKTLKDKYRIPLDQGLTTDGVTAVASVVTSVLQAVNPAFAVSSVVVFFSIWLLKVGLNHWCSVAPAA